MLSRLLSPLFCSLQIDLLCSKLDASNKQTTDDHFPNLQLPGMMSNSTPIWPRRPIQPGSGQARPQKTKPQPEVNREEHDVNKAFAMARRCVGLFPISAEDIESHHDATKPKTNDNFQKAGIAAVRSYFKSVMKLASDSADNLAIEGVFYQGKGAASNTLYVELSHQNDLAIVRNAAVNMINTNEINPKLIQYIPTLLKPRYNAILNLAYEGRTGSSVRKASKIWIKSQNFELRFKAKGDATPWSEIQPEDIPALLTAKKASLSSVDSSQQLRTKRPSAQLHKLSPEPGSEYDNLLTVNIPTEEPLITGSSLTEEPLIRCNIPTSNKFEVFQSDQQYLLH